MLRRSGLTAPLRSVALASCVLLSLACRSSAGPQPQAATFPSGQRVAHSGGVALELAAARYDLREVSVTVRLTNQGKAPVSVGREGILLAYRELEFPVGKASPVEASTTVPPGGTVELELGFGTEQMMVEAGTLQLLSLRAGEAWLAPLALTVPPPAAFVEAAAERENEEEEE